MDGLIDTHAHLQDEAFSVDFADVLARIRATRPAAVINAGTDLATSRRAVEMARAEPGFWALAGVHPHEAKTWNASTRASLEELLAEPETIGVGEIGLDYHYDFSPRDTQREVFLTQWRLAAELDLPAIIHVREAFDDFFAFIADGPRPSRVLLHCFSGNLDIARRALDAGFSFSIGGPLTYPKSEETRTIFRFLPDDRIHLETDCPYLAPVPFRGKRNDPSLLQHTFRKLCEIRQADPDELAAILRENAVRFFAPRLRLVTP
ncbi:MAG TPA: TatD family hydrolase [Candidatus Ozemobacteraceae bacterium]|nr:TatD family hydrolase [Candidatus Ozemobacteraceae bacterium]